ncbi:DUF1508 domain-containing protein, partial [Glaesserella parasuis]|nr:YegP family protein [Glaesserella parasuis]MWQ35920.1 YegP family protein [Glaesserella parasuis]MWQ43982.1 DUF1508 domain-containing protein [Glaesserella parasuis]
RLKSANHETIASSEGYTTKQNCLHCIGLVMDTTQKKHLFMKFSVQALLEQGFKFVSTPDNYV